MKRQKKLKWYSGPYQPSAPVLPNPGPWTRRAFLNWSFRQRSSWIRSCRHRSSRTRSPGLVFSGLYLPESVSLDSIFQALVLWNQSSRTRVDLLTGLGSSNTRCYRNRFTRLSPRLRLINFAADLSRPQLLESEKKEENKNDKYIINNNSIIDNNFELLIVSHKS